MPRTNQAGLTRKFFSHGFVKYAVMEHPVILLTDGHRTHINIDILDLCHENNMILFCLPPHTTHALQPLDVAVFKSLSGPSLILKRIYCVEDGICLYCEASFRPFFSFSRLL